MALKPIDLETPSVEILAQLADAERTIDRCLTDTYDGQYPVNVSFPREWSHRLRQKVLKVYRAAGWVVNKEDRKCGQEPIWEFSPIPKYNIRERGLCER